MVPQEIICRLNRTPRGPEERGAVVAAIVAGRNPVDAVQRDQPVRQPGSAVELTADLQSWFALRDAAFVSLATAIAEDPASALKYSRLIQQFDKLLDQTAAALDLVVCRDRPAIVRPPINSKDGVETLVQRLIDRNGLRIKLGFLPWVPNSLAAIENPDNFKEYAQAERTLYADLEGLSFYLPGVGGKVAELSERFGAPAGVFHHKLVALEVANRIAGRAIDYEIPEALYSRPLV